MALGPDPTLPNIRGHAASDVVQKIDAIESWLRSVASDLRALDLATSNPGQALTPSAAKVALQVNGSNPLDVTGLIGVLAQPQNAAVPLVSVLPPVQSTNNGQLVNFKGVVYYLDGSTNPGTWTVLAAAAVAFVDTHSNRIANFPPANYPIGTLFIESDRLALYRLAQAAGVKNWTLVVNTPFACTLGAKPAFTGTHDAGFQIWATDYNRPYVWSGTVWSDGPSAPSRYQVGLFAVAPEPLAGWLLCDGTVQARSTSAGAIAAYTPPDLLTGTPFLAGDTLASTGTFGTTGTDYNYARLLPYIRV